MDKPDPPAANDNKPLTNAANDNKPLTKAANDNEAAAKPNAAANDNTPLNKAANDNEPKGNDLGKVTEKVKATAANDNEPKKTGPLTNSYFLRAPNTIIGGSGGGNGEDEVNKIIIRKLDLIDKKLSMIDELAKQIKNIIEEHIELQHKRYEELELKEEEGDKIGGKKALSCEQCKEKEKENPIVAFFKKIDKLKETLIGFVAMIIPMGVTLVKKLIDNVREKLSEVVRFVEKALSSAIKGVTGFLANFVKGLTEGIAFLLDLIPGGLGKGAAAALRKGGKDVAKSIEDAGKAADKYVTAKGESIATSVAAPPTRAQERTSLQKPGISATGGKQATAQEVASKNKGSETGLMKAAQSSGITDPVELAQFMAQASVETANFATLREYGNDQYFAKYDGRRDLGNSQPGDGAKYKGRGYLQITGRANYAHFGSLIGVDLVNNPQLAEEPDVAAKISIAYWNERVKKRVSDFNDTEKVTKIINGGYNGLAQRKANFEKYSKQSTSKPAAATAAAPSGPPTPAKSNAGAGAGAGGGTSSAKPTPAPKAPKAVASPSTVSSEAAATKASTPSGAMAGKKKMPDKKRANSTQQYIPSPAYHSSKADDASVFFMANEPHMGVA